MKIQIKGIEFCIADGKIRLTKCGGFTSVEGCVFSEVQISGENKNTHMGIKMAESSEGARLRYVSHTQSEHELVIVQRSDLVEVTTTLTAYGDCNAVSAFTEVANISDTPIVIEEVAAFVCGDIGTKGIDSAPNLYFTRFTQSHHAECQPIRHSFADLGLYRVNKESQKRIAFANIGSWSTKEELPQGIIEDTENSAFTMFQIESNNSWYYEIADRAEKYYLYLGGANLPFGGWSKKLLQNESYQTVKVALAFGKTLNEVLGEMSKYRRYIAGHCISDESLPTIFNEYMHLSWDSPSAVRTAEYAPAVAKMGIEYYVIDCGWHDEEDGNAIYPYVGKWLESNKRFPNGLKVTLDYIKSLGMKPGLWIEPEIIGCKCAEMIDFYDDDSFLQRNGRRLCVMNRHFLDYRNVKVVEYMTETIRRMVEDYGAEYIKLDYNQDCGVGTDYNAFTAGEGLELASAAYLEWIDTIRQNHPNVIFETCSSGGMRMDYATLSHFSIISTSDQVDYKKYPYIAGNILSAVLPEQAAVWSYPVETFNFEYPDFSKEYIEENISDEQVIMNMINSFLGRMHLASRLTLLTEKKQSLVREGVEYYNSISNEKKRALPYLPCGLTSFGSPYVASGFKTDKKLYLAVWNISGNGAVQIQLPEITPSSVRVAYPKCNDLAVRLENDTLTINFTDKLQARMLEIDL
ncbi:MAG: alpha-galactosidase [Clostridia bacterium]|nr:alpha-galactosidase [Clostridia bacterium]